MSAATANYSAQMASALQENLKEQMGNYMKTLPAKIQNAISIDQDAFASAFKMKLSDEQLQDAAVSMMASGEKTYDGNLASFGYADFDAPYEIVFYPRDFEAKEKTKEFIDEYNKKMEDAGDKEKMVEWTDIIGTMMSSVTKMVNLVSAGLIAFISISLVVSSIMIGVITYISVLERRKEIGILRAMGARKKDIRNIFNSETMITGLFAGVIGVLVAALITIPTNIIVENVGDISNIAVLPVSGAIILVAISVFLTFISGLIPASSAAKKDAAEALRSE
jgi:ABC-type antimicrobial peptide transport system permease subunit